MSKCLYCEQACTQTVCETHEKDKINSYGQKITVSVEPPMLCSVLCCRAQNKMSLRRNLEAHLVELASIACGLREAYPFIDVFVEKTILFYKSDITRKDYLELVSETLELVNALQDEELLQIVCHTQALAIRLEQLLKTHKVKFPKNWDKFILLYFLSALI